MAEISDSGEPSGDGEPSGEFPIQDDVILEKIFKYCNTVEQACDGSWACSNNTNDLKTIRQVCRKWMESSTNIWRSKASLVLLPEMDEHTNGLSIQEFMEMYDNDTHQFKTIPFRCFFMEGFTLNQELMTATQAYWVAVGPTIQKLRFIHTKPEVENTEIGWNLLEAALPTLEFSYHSRWCLGYSAVSVLTVEEINLLKATPLMNTLGLGDMLNLSSCVIA